PGPKTEARCRCGAWKRRWWLGLVAMAHLMGLGVTFQTDSLMLPHGGRRGPSPPLPRPRDQPQGERFLDLHARRRQRPSSGRRADPAHAVGGTLAMNIEETVGTACLIEGGRAMHQRLAPRFAFYALLLAPLTATAAGAAATPGTPSAAPDLAAREPL